MTRDSATALLRIAAHFESLEERILLDAQDVENASRAGRTDAAARRALERRIANYTKQVEAFHTNAARFVEHPLWKRLEGLGRRLES